MDDFRSQIATTIDAMTELSIEPVFVVIDLWGAEDVKRVLGPESMQQLRDGAIDSVANTCGGAVFAYTEFRLVAILPGPTRLKTFALIQKLTHALPLLGQSFDCILRPDFDVLDYDPQGGVAGIINQLVKLPLVRSDAA